eukprot:TRINITY_DN2206_c0_g1_i1.p1 TRINITY_DN2206_c0_g1~~TRINITY_DN2206_c0_g1_i1.p1  ORF type:complete len:184 (-),score=78.67 TRINITY_DN2206_c0_g1_i1:46-528(-)
MFSEETLEQLTFVNITLILLIIILVIKTLSLLISLFTEQPSAPQPIKTRKIEQRDFTKEELFKFNGQTSDKIYISIKGTVYDVSSRSNFYGPGCAYSIFAGREASRALAKSSLKVEDVENTDLSDLTGSEISTLNDWIQNYDMKYPVIGKVVEIQDKKDQ